MRTDSFIFDLKTAFPFLNEMEASKFNDLFHAIRFHEYPKGTTLLQEGHPCNGITLILDGSVRVFKLSPDGREITLYRIGRGETCVLSISCAMGNADYPAIAEVEENAKLIVIPVSVFKILFSNDPAWQKYFFAALLNRLTEVMLLVEEITFKSMDKRLGIFLVDKLAKNYDKNTIETTHEQIALELGTAREVISRLLKDFEKQGLIVLSRGKIEVLNRVKMLELFPM
jgi:CRP/FNR family transcriptional regulator, anaerobic regulatory protein